ncbi:MAG: PDZ domain-containing protein [Patescibacteria group bacterium]|nr:PDZ domain-containing protein [Patescibacteria group bacterium]
MKLFKKRKTKVSLVVPAVIISVTFGLAAGVVGMLVMLAYFPIPPYSPATGTVVPRIPFAPTESNRVPSDMAVRDLSRPLTTFYKTEDVQGIILPARAIGAGVVLTSDGWIITHESALETTWGAAEKRLVAMVEGETYPISETVTDPHTDVVFMKVSGNNLPVASFGRSSDVEVGNALFAFDAGQGLYIADVIDHDDWPAENEVSAVRSSESMQKVFRLSGAAGLLPGSVLMNSAGQIVAVYVGEGVLGPIAIPLDSFFSLVGEVLRDRTVTRPYLGARFVDLSEYPEFNKDVDRGVRLTSYGGLSAVVRRSPAALAGLRDGDIIVSVNDEAVTTNKSLPGIISEYGPGDTITLTILRNGVELDVDIVLEQVP